MIKTDAEIVAAYRSQFDAGGDSEHFWAWEAVNQRCDSLDDGTAITLQLILAAEDEQYLAYVAAGPLEDLLKMHGSKAIAKFAKAGAKSGNVRRAMAGVWLRVSDQAYPDWRKLMNEWGFQ